MKKEIQEKKDEIENYSAIQGLSCFGLCLLNDFLRGSNNHPSILLNNHLWDFSMGALLTSALYATSYGKEDSKTSQIASIAIPTIMLSAYEFASQNPYIFGTYDPRDILAYGLGSVTAWAGVKLFGTKEKRTKVKKSLERLNPLNLINYKKQGLEKTIRE